ncbi:MAG: NAD(P)-dependent oxidoreductase [Candidatus Omnitrophica bacterium]|nr:NAD(P)-dependent oxidoreductase [Candidatus Omnitrophota bacterium]
MKILIIGNKGFIGGHMSRYLIKQGHKIVGLDITAQNDDSSGYFTHKGDILNEDDVLVAAKGVELVINLAAKHHDFGISREDFFLINESGTRNCLNCLSKLGIKRFVFFSTVAVYGTHDFEIDESTPYVPSNDYGESKLAGEKLIEKWASEDATREVLIVRPVVVYGPKNYANMFRLIDNIYLKRFFMVGDGANKKSTAYVENLVEATFHMIQRMSAGIERFNYSDLPQKTSIEIANIIRKELGLKPIKFKFPLSLAVFLAYPFDIAAKFTNKNFPITAKRIKKFNANTLYASDKVRKLGYQQRFSSDEGLKRMVAWYLEEGKFHRTRCAIGPEIKKVK